MVTRLLKSKDNAAACWCFPLTYRCFPCCRCQKTLPCQGLICTVNWWYSLEWLIVLLSVVSEAAPLICQAIGQKNNNSPCHDCINPSLVSHCRLTRYLSTIVNSIIERMIGMSQLAGYTGNANNGIQSSRWNACVQHRRILLSWRHVSISIGATYNI